MPARIWMATVKPAYNFVTRRLMHWSDSEGTEDRLDRDGPAIRAALKAAGVEDHAVATFSLPARGIGLYVFAATEGALPDLPAEHVQRVPALPRRDDGGIRDDLLALVAANRLDELDAALAHEPDLRPVMAPIVAGRLNLTDRLSR